MASKSLVKAASSSSSSLPRWNYDVFLSFRGEDVRKTFVDHLYSALHQRGIHTFKDDEKLERGKSIGSELLKSIEQSRFAVVVFSQNYASSSWCLDELVKIIECSKLKGQTVLPFFYNVDPSEVRKQTGHFGEVFAKHDLDKVEIWKAALSEAASLSGWDLKNTADGLLPFDKMETEKFSACILCFLKRSAFGTKKIIIIKIQRGTLSKIDLM